MAKIVVVGSINTDLVVQTSHLPGPGETVLGNTFQQVAGGKGANQAVAAARAGGDVSLIGCVGDDQLGQEAIGSLDRAGVDVTHVHRVTGLRSGVALIMVDAKGQNCIAVAPGANEAVRAEAVEAATPLFADADVLLLQLETPMETVVAAAALAHRLHVRVVLDPAPAPPNGLPDALWPHVSIVTPNTTEASALSGIAVGDSDTAWEVGRHFVERGVEAALITRGAAGVSLTTRDSRVTIDGLRVNTRDTTAAGDVFAGAMATRLAEGATLVEATRFGNAAAALAVTVIGAQPSAPTRTAILGALG